MPLGLLFETQARQFFNNLSKSIIDGTNRTLFIEQRDKIDKLLHDVSRRQFFNTDPKISEELGELQTDIRNIYIRNGVTPPVFKFTQLPKGKGIFTTIRRPIVTGNTEEENRRQELINMQLEQHQTNNAELVAHLTAGIDNFLHELAQSPVLTDAALLNFIQILKEHMPRYGYILLTNLEIINGDRVLVADEQMRIRIERLIGNSNNIYDLSIEKMQTSDRTEQQELELTIQRFHIDSIHILSSFEICDPGETVRNIYNRLDYSCNNPQVIAECLYELHRQQEHLTYMITEHTKILNLIPETLNEQIRILFRKVQDRIAELIELYAQYLTTITGTNLINRINEFPTLFQIPS